VFGALSPVIVLGVWFQIPFLIITPEALVAVCMSSALVNEHYGAGSLSCLISFVLYDGSSIIFSILK
jgi:hypothetical protein